MLVVTSRSRSASSTTSWRSTRWKLHTRLSCSVKSPTLIVYARSARRGHSQRTTRSTPKSSRMPSAVPFNPCRPLPPHHSLGGDHTVVLPILRSLNKVYGPVSVIHFDAHIDTWAPWAEQERITHGTFFYVAHEEGLLSNTSVHAGIRCKMTVRPNLAGALRVYV